MFVFFQVLSRRIPHYLKVYRAGMRKRKTKMLLNLLRTKIFLRWNQLFEQFE